MLKPVAKRILLGGTKWLGLNAALRRKSRDSLLVLCYHSVLSQSRPPNRLRTRNAVSVEVFKQQLRILSERFNPVSATQVLDFVHRRGHLPNSPVLVTFDDGFRNNFTLAAGELDRYKVPALIHVATGYIGRSDLLWPQEVDERVLNWSSGSIPMPDGTHLELPDSMQGRRPIASQVRSACKRLSNDERESYLVELRDEPLPAMDDWQHELYDFATWEEIRAFHDPARGFEIGAHTVSHPILTRLDRTTLSAELTRSKATIESELGVPCPWIAYPNGGPDDVNPEVMDAARVAGYEVGFTLTGQLNDASSGPWAIDRMCVTADLQRHEFEAMISGVQAKMRRLLQSRGH